LAGERGITVLATLHQVDMALAHFSRIVGLRDGQLAFDLPRTSVTQAHLKKLYAHHEDELNGPAPGGIEEPSPPPVVLMSCR
jgi:phosphonate transport system ATP-binding protein